MSVSDDFKQFQQDYAYIRAGLEDTAPSYVIPNLAESLLWIQDFIENNEVESYINFLLTNKEIEYNVYFFLTNDNSCKLIKGAKVVRLQRDYDETDPVDLGSMICITYIPEGESAEESCWFTRVSYKKSWCVARRS